LTGYATDIMCPTCDFAFDIEFYHVEDEDEDQEEPMNPNGMNGEPIKAESLEDCLSPDLPAHQEVRRLGFSSTEGIIYFDYFNSGIWIPWYEALKIHDNVTLNWEASLGFFGFMD
jgi:hypothetical protein